MSLLHYWHTLRHLKGSQLAARATRRFKRLDLAPPIEQCLRASLAAIGIDPWRQCALDRSDNFTFLNETRCLLDDADWNKPGVPKLWLYNLHYFDWINALHAHADTAIFVDTATRWITRWIAENPAPHGNGWEPYPLSLRIVNWIKWLVRQTPIGPVAATAIFRSLELQSHVLSQRFETDLLGNHLFENAKALIFAGCFFDGGQARTWFDHGARVLSREIGEQILPDGGYFELSPMYHSIILEDVLAVLSHSRPIREVVGGARTRSSTSATDRRIDARLAQRHDSPGLPDRSSTTQQSGSRPLCRRWCGMPIDWV